MSRRSVFLVAAVLFCLPRSALGQPQQLRDLAGLVDGVKRAIFERKRPGPGPAKGLKRLAGEIDWVEHKLETFGSVVAKQPDVYGEARLMRHRHEYEREISKRFDEEKFDETLQAAIRTSDQSLAAAALALGDTVNSDGELPTNSASALLTSTNDGSQPDIQRGSVKALELSSFGDEADGSSQRLRLEPTVVSNQLSRYLYNLNQLRRINEGDDTADSPGYSLVLLRIPVSVLPGHRTRSGHGAEITMTAQPILTDDLLPSTFKSLVINDVVAQHSLNLTRLFEKDRNKLLRQLWANGVAEQRAETWLDAMYSRLEQQTRRFKSELGDEKLFDDFAESVRRNREYFRMRFQQIAVLAVFAEWLEREPEALSVFRLSKAEEERIREFVLYRDDRSEVRVSRNKFANLLDQLFVDGRGELKAQSQGAVDGPSVPVTITIEEVEPADLDPNHLRQPDEPVHELQSGSMPYKYKAEVEVPELPGILSFLNKHLNEHLTTNYHGQLSGELSATADLFESGAGPMVDQNFGTYGGFVVPSRGAAARQPFSPSHFIHIYGWELFDIIASGVNRVLAGEPANYKTYAHLTDVRKALEMETRAAYKLFERPYERRSGRRQRQGCDKLLTRRDQDPEVAWSIQQAPHQLWRHADRDLAHAIRTMDWDTVRQRRKIFMDDLGDRERSITGALAWAILVNATLLNERLHEDMNRIASSKNCGCGVDGDMRFYLPAKKMLKVKYAGRSNEADATNLSQEHSPIDDTPITISDDLEPIPLGQLQALDESSLPEYYCYIPQHLSDTAQAKFKKYVQCRWPITVFALDPVTQDQNVAEVFSRRRELQLAAAVAVADGNMNPNVAGRFVRRLETDIQTIALNRTSIAFSHDEHVFGWRFFPRVQTPPTPGTLVAFGQTLLGGPSRDADVRSRRLEPAIRECTALVLLPSFVPFLKVESRASWFSLTNPRHKQLTTTDSVKLSHHFYQLKQKLDHECECFERAIQQATFQAAEQDWDVDGQAMVLIDGRAVVLPTDSDAELSPELAHMKTSLQQMEKRLPWQVAKVQIPHENTLGGFELFNTGASGLAPDLLGWYGAPGIDPTGATTLFLVGTNFSVLETRVIAGGRYVPYRLLSRDIMEVVIPPSVQTINTGKYKDLVDIHLATPYGVSSHLLVPLAPQQQAVDGRFVWGTRSFALTVEYSASPNVASVYPSRLELVTPTLATQSPVKVNLWIVEQRDGKRFTLATKEDVDARLDVRTQRYVIDGNSFKDFEEAVAAAAKARFGDTEPTPGQKASWKVFGTVTSGSGTPDQILGGLDLTVTFENP